MLYANWDLLNGPVAHEIEALNYANQVNFIEALIKYVVALGGVTDAGQATHAPNILALKELHRTATLFLLERPGEFRDVHVHVQASDGEVLYDAPAPTEVLGHIEQFFVDLGINWSDQSPLYVAAFCLWKINWIHPFPNGNGRSARAFSYACLCLKFGFSLPGQVTVIDLIMTKYRRDYVDALRIADKSFSEEGITNIAPLESLLTDLLIVSHRVV